MLLLVTDLPRPITAWHLSHCKYVQLPPKASSPSASFLFFLFLSSLFCMSPYSKALPRPFPLQPHLTPVPSVPLLRTHADMVNICNDYYKSFLTAQSTPPIISHWIFNTALILWPSLYWWRNLNFRGLRSMLEFPHLKTGRGNAKSLTLSCNTHFSCLFTLTFPPDWAPWIQWAQEWNTAELAISN